MAALHFFCAYSLKIIVFCSADHRLAPPQSCSCSLSQHKPCVLRRDYQCLPLLTAQTNGRRRCSPFSSVVSGSQHQIPSCLSLQSAGQTCSQPSSLKQSSKNGWTWSRRSVSFWILRGRICFLSAVSVFHSSSEDYSVLRLCVMHRFLLRRELKCVLTPLLPDLQTDLSFSFLQKRTPQIMSLPQTVYAPIC